MSKADQIDKCMRLALDKSTTEQEALSAFKTARKLIHIHGYANLENGDDDYKGGRQIQLSVSNLLGLTTAISDLADRIDLRIKLEFFGSSLNPELKATYRGKKLRVEAMDQFITDSFAHIQKKRKKEAVGDLMDELAKALQSQPKRKKSIFGSWFS